MKHPYKAKDGLRKNPSFLSLKNVLKSEPTKVVVAAASFVIVLTAIVSHTGSSVYIQGPNDFSLTIIGSPQ